jgi:hypothetical protein
LEIALNPISIITGAPGTGKSLVAQELCHRKGKKEAFYFCLTQPLTNAVNHQGKADAFLVRDCQDILKYLSDDEHRDRTFAVLDDAQNLSWEENTLRSLCNYCIENTIDLLFCLDSTFHDYQNQGKRRTLTTLVTECGNDHHQVVLSYQLKDIYRNSQVVTSYMQSAFDSQQVKVMVSKSGIRGEDVKITCIDYISEFRKGNGIVNLVQQLCSRLVNSQYLYKPNDVAILIDREDPESTAVTVNFMLEVFRKYWPNGHAQRASLYPFEGVVIEALDEFVGMDASAVICPVWKTSEWKLEDSKFRCMVASRAVMYVEFLQAKQIDSYQTKYHRFDKVGSLTLDDNRKVNR